MAATVDRLQVFQPSVPPGTDSRKNGTESGKSGTETGRTGTGRDGTDLRAPGRGTDEYL